MSDMDYEAVANMNSNELAIMHAEYQSLKAQSVPKRTIRQMLGLLESGDYGQKQFFQKLMEISEDDT